MKSFLSLTAIMMLFLAACSKNKPKQERVYPIAVAEVSQQDVPIYIKVIGNVYSLRIVEIRPQVGGVLEEAYVAEGQYVKKGDPLYKIDPRQYQAAVDKAKATLLKDQATLNFSEKQVERNKELTEQDYVSKLTYEQYLSQMAFNKAVILSDQADLDFANLQLEWCVPTSPITGKISAYNIDPGNLVTANDPNALTTIRQMTPADIHFNITQKEFTRVQEALKRGRLKFEAILPQDPLHPREGSIYFVDNHIDLTTGTILLKGTVDNEDEKFWPGEFVNVWLHLKTEEHALLVPEEAVNIGHDGSYVYIYVPESSTAEYRLVTRGEKVDHQIVIEKGVKLGEKVIIRGQHNLLPGAKVYISNDGESEVANRSKKK